MNQLRDNNRLVLSVSGIAVFLYAWTMIRSVWLAFNSTQYSSLFYLFNQVTGYLCIPFGIASILIYQDGKTNPGNGWLLIIPFTYYLMGVLNNYENVGVTYGMVSAITAMIFLLFNEELKSKVFNTAYWLIQAMNLLSLLMWVLYFLNIRIGFSIVPFYSEKAVANGMYYIKWGIFAIYNQGLTYRLCSVFNEPGALGTLCALLFVIRFNRMKMWERVTLILTGALTFSMAFYLMIFAYLALWLIRKDFRLVFIAVAIAVFFLNIPNIDWGNESLNALARRMRITDSGIDARRVTETFDYAYDNMVQSGRALFGYGYGYSVGGGNSSYKVMIMEFGFIGFLLLLAEWMICSIKYNKNLPDGYILILFFILSLYHRPRTMVFIYGYVIIFGGLSWLRSGLETGEESSSLTNVSE